MQQPLVPWYFAASIIVINAMLVYTLATDGPLNPPIYVNYLIGVASIGLTTLAAVLNIKAPEKPPAP
jgi:hypothetical protein